MGQVSTQRQLANYAAVNKANNIDRLLAAVEFVGYIPVGIHGTLDPGEVIDAISAAYNDREPLSNVPVIYGIRAQLMMIMYYENRLHLL